MALKCIYTNCLSLRNKLLELEQLVTEKKPHIIALTETWLSPDILDSELQLKNYTFIRKDSLRGKLGGVAFFIHSSVPSCTISHPSLQTNYCDVLWLTIPLHSSDMLLIGLVYRSPSCCTLESEQLLQHLSEVTDKHDASHVLLLGDFNAPSINWSRMSADSGFPDALLQLAVEQAWTQHVTFPTRFRPGQNPSCLDLIFSSAPHLIDEVHPLPPLGFSDHIILSHDIICYWARPDITCKFLRCFNKTDFNGMSSHLQESLREVTPTESVDHFYTSFTNSLTVADTLFVPRVRKQNSGKPPLPRHVRRLLSKRNHLFVRQKVSGSSRDLEAYRISRNICKSEIRRVERQRQSRILQRASSNHSVLFKYMRSRRKDTPSCSVLRLDDGSTSSSTSVVAEIFRRQFASVFSQPDVAIPSFSNRPFFDPLTLTQFSQQEVEHELLSLNPYTAFGPDELHPRILKETAKTISPVLTSIYNLSITSGSVPSVWKEAIISPIFKGGDRFSPSSYRPISLTCITCKILERLIKRVMLSHLLSNGLLSRSQHGFLPGRSCITNLILFEDSLMDAYDRGVLTDAVFFDFSKAFDRVPHGPLLHKLQAYGIGRVLCQWIEAFLTGRSFRVRIGSHLSDPSPVTSGVPQGSVLGPILFLIYVNDLPDHLEVDSLFYADDLKIWSSDAVSLQRDIDKVKQWSIDWSLPLNETKCAHVSFGGPSGNNFYLQDGGPALTNADKVKDLGVWFSSNLSFSHHHEMSVRKAWAVLGMIRRSFPRITIADFKLLYGTYVRPLLEYCSSVTHTGLVKDANLLERVQRKATKLVVGLKNLPYEERLVRLQLYPLQTRRLRGDILLTHHLFSSGLNLALFPPNTSTYCRGHERKIFERRPRTFLRQHSFSFRVVEPWNNLPREAALATDKRSLKAAVDVHLGLIS